VFTFQLYLSVNLPSIRVQSVAPGPRVLLLSSGFAGPIEAFEPASIFGPMSATVHRAAANEGSDGTKRASKQHQICSYLIAGAVPLSRRGANLLRSGDRLAD
jgi:hypothetical protein